MEDKLKNRVMLALGILSVILLVTTINSCKSQRSQESRWRKEMALRLDSEEKANKITQDQAVLSEKLRKSEEALQESGKSLESAKKALVQEQLVNQNLRVEMDKLNKLKQALEEDLKEALVNGAAKPQSKLNKK